MNNTTELQKEKMMAQTQKFETTFTLTLEDTQPSKSAVTFDQIFTEAVDSALSMLGDQTKYAIYRHLEANYSLSKNDLPHNVTAFINGLDDIFGEASLLIEMRIMLMLKKRVAEFNVESSNVDFSFLNYAEALLRFISSN